jgi:phage gpG-like protein
MLRVSVTGDKKLEKKFKDEKRMKNPMALFLEIMGRDIVNTAQQYSPVDEGILRNSFKAEVRTNSNPMVAVVSSNVIYAAPLEFSGYKPRKSGVIPFFRPAIDYVLRKLDKRAKELGKNVEKEYKKP